MVKKYTKILACSIVSVIISLFICELFIRIFSSHHLIYDIEMTQYTMHLKINSKNPLIHHENRPNSRGIFMGVPIVINSDGLRDYEHDIKKKEKYRILFLGDSITLGWGVQQKNTFKSLIEKWLNKTKPAEIINFGVGNYNTEQELNLFKEKGLKYKPDKVVVFTFINDAEQTPNKSTNWWFIGYSDLVIFLWSKLQSFYISYNSQLNYQQYYRNLYDEKAQGWYREKQAFKELKDICNRNGIELQVILVPELHNLKNYPFKKEQMKLSSYLNSLGIPNLDLTPLFSNWDDPMKLWVAQDDAHPNEIANTLIADYSKNFIEGNKK